MSFGKLEKILLTLCVMSVVASVGYYIKDGFRTYDSKVQYEEGTPLITVKIDGEVEKPDTYKIAENSRVCDLIYAAGGITQAADVERVDTDAILTEGMHITIPSFSDEDYSGVPVINVNKADIEELMLIPGVGEELAKRIIDYRTENGKFSDISEIVRVRGLGDKTFEKVKDYIKTED